MSSAKVMGDRAPPSKQCPEVQIALSHFLGQVQTGQVQTKHQTPRLLHWNSVGECLEEYAWPLDPETGLRIHPSKLESFRRTHTFRGPSCLCAFIDIEDYTEARIGIVQAISDTSETTHSILKGEYVAVCAKQRCGYFLCLERLYSFDLLKTRFYFERDSPLPPQDLLHASDFDKKFRGADGLFQAMSTAVVRGKGGRLPCMSPQEAQEPKQILIRDLSEGVSENRFWSLFVQCLICRQVMFKGTMVTTHSCKLQGKTSRHGCQPYPRFARPKTFIRARLKAIPGDQPESPRLHSLRSSPAPTEVDEGETVSDFQASGNSIDPSSFLLPSSDLDFPSFP